MATIHFTFFNKIRLLRTLLEASILLLSISLVMFLAQPVLAQARGKSIWSIVPNPNPNPHILSNDQLAGVAAISDTDVWTVGFSNSIRDGVINHTLTEHWNGTSWQLVSSPDVGKLGSDLQAVSAVSSKDVWAVGDFNTSNNVNGARTLIEHWNGAAWSVVSSPNLSMEGDFLSGVAAISSKNVWAIGWYENNGQSDIAPLILHWNGTAWSVVTNGVPSGGSIFLHGLTALSANDIWAVGESGSGPTNFEMHWNGTTWSVVPHASFPSFGQESLGGVAGASSKDVWAVGSYVPTFGAEQQTLIVHWDGSQWSKVISPNVDKFFNFLFATAAVSKSDIWAVGYAYTPDGLHFHTLIERWDGTRWSIVSSPNKSFHGDSANELRAVTLSGPATLWAAGTFVSFDRGNPGIRTLLLHTTQG